MHIAAFYRLVVVIAVWPSLCFYGEESRGCPHAGLSFFEYGQAESCRLTRNPRPYVANSLCGAELSSSKSRHFNL